MNIKWTTERLDVLKQMLLSGMSLQECGDHFGLSRSAIYLARKIHLPEITRSQFGQGLRRENRKKIREDDLHRRTTDITLAQKSAFGNKAANARRGKWEFTITMDDLAWPTHCPVLGIELDWFSPRKAENSPSFDRIDPTKGYIPGNVKIISWRANRIKNDGTAFEHEKIAAWMKQCVTPLDEP